MIEIFSIIIINLVIFCIYLIYQSYKDYTELDGKSIKSPGDVIDFLKFIVQKLINWIKCNILGLFSHKFRRICFTDAVILSQEEEQSLDAATPGSLTQARIMLLRDQARQTEDYERVNEDLDNLENAIIDGNAEEIFRLSDDVVMDEEALYWRAWITAQTSQMTHNLVNMEICNADGNVIDYMDLSATGLGKDGISVPNKSGKDFRWSNRCMNVGSSTMGYQESCLDPVESGILQEEERNKFWIDETTTGLGETNSNDTNNIDTRNDNEIFNTGNFSGYNCNFYAKYFCKDGYPDIDNHADMFGKTYNWPELNCCACGGGSRPEVSNRRNKYELIFKNLPNFTDGTSSQNISLEMPNGTMENINLHSVPQVYSLELSKCKKNCDEDSNCAGVIFQSKAAIKFDEEIRESIDYDLIDPHYENLKKSLHGASSDMNNSSDHTFIYKVNQGVNWPTKLYGTCKKVMKNVHNNATDYLFNRNYFNGSQENSSIQGVNTSLLLKKMPEDFQNISNGTIQSENSSDTNNDTHQYDLEYDTFIENNAFEETITNCSQLCSNLDNYKVKQGKEETPCGPYGCKRSECCELNTCGNDLTIDCKDMSQHCKGPDGTVRRCGINYSKNNNILCDDTGCTTQQCCYKSHCAPPADKLLSQELKDQTQLNNVSPVEAGSSRLNLLFTNRDVPPIPIKWWDIYSRGTQGNSDRRDQHGRYSIPGIGEICAQTNDMGTCTATSSVNQAAQDMAISDGILTYGISVDRGTWSLQRNSNSILRCQDNGNDSWVAGWPPNCVPGSNQNC